MTPKAVIELLLLADAEARGLLVMKGTAAHIAAPGTLQGEPGSDNIHNIDPVNEPFDKILFDIGHFFSPRL